MRIIADFHLHSRYSRACSRNLTLSNLAAWAATKGIDLLATSDFTHPKWLADIEERLESAEEGLFRLKKAYRDEDGDHAYVAAPKPADAREVRFLLGTELSCIYKKGGKTRRLHLLVFAPSLIAARKIVVALEKRGCNLRSDGRPILGLDAREVVKIALEADEHCMVIPAHAWTPWYSVFGSESGFDSLEECFEDLTPHIHAIETGLSSDPAMNGRLSQLDGVMLLSNSDAHGVRNLGREANVFDLDTMSYDTVMDVLRKRQRDRFPYTIEFYPEEGKYHVDGHRACDFVCDPEETVRRKGVCPKCGKPLTRGVLGRVHALADRNEKVGRAHAQSHKSIVPLEELIGEALGKGKASKAVFAQYAAVISGVGSEFDVLLEASLEHISAASNARIADAVGRVRAGRVSVSSGYDGVFGSVKVFGVQTKMHKRRGT